MQPGEASQAIPDIRIRIPGSAHPGYPDQDSGIGLDRGYPDRDSGIVTDIRISLSGIPASGGMGGTGGTPPRPPGKPPPQISDPQVDFSLQPAKPPRTRSVPSGRPRYPPARGTPQKPATGLRDDPSRHREDQPSRLLLARVRRVATTSRSPSPTLAPAGRSVPLANGRGGLYSESCDLVGEPP